MVDRKPGEVLKVGVVHVHPFHLGLARSFLAPVQQSIDLLGLAGGDYSYAAIRQVHHATGNAENGSLFNSALSEKYALHLAGYRCQNCLHVRIISIKLIIPHLYRLHDFSCRQVDRLQDDLLGTAGKCLAHRVRFAANDDMNEAGSHRLVRRFAASG